MSTITARALSRSEPYVRQEVLAEKYSNVLGRLNFGDEVMMWLTQSADGKPR
jgi:hypothetical protein